MKPSASSSRYARATVFGASPRSSASFRTVGIRVPAASSPDCTSAMNCVRSCSYGGVEPSCSMVITGPSFRVCPRVVRLPPEMWAQTHRAGAKGVGLVVRAMNETRKNDRGTGVVDVGRDAHALESDFEGRDVARPHVHDRIR